MSCNGPPPSGTECLIWVALSVITIGLMISFYLDDVARDKARKHIEAEKHQACLDRGGGAYLKAMLFIDPAFFIDRTMTSPTHLVVEGEADQPIRGNERLFALTAKSRAFKAITTEKRLLFGDITDNETDVLAHEMLGEWKRELVRVNEIASMHPDAILNNMPLRNVIVYPYALHSFKAINSRSPVIGFKARYGIGNKGFFPTNEWDQEYHLLREAQLNREINRA